jgi:hypothetical protein
MQCAVDVEVNVTAFVSKIAGSAVLTRVEVHKGAQVRIHCVVPSFGCLRVHRELSIKMRRRIHPNDIEAFGTFGACPNGQRIFEVRRVHLVT